MPFFSSSHRWNRLPERPDLNRQSELLTGARYLVTAHRPYDLASDLPLIARNNPIRMASDYGVGIYSAAEGLSYAGYKPVALSSGSVYSQRYDVTAPPITVIAVGSTSGNNGRIIVRGNGSGVPSYSVGGYYGTLKGLQFKLRTVLGSVSVIPSQFEFDCSRMSVYVLSVGVNSGICYAGNVGSNVTETPFTTPAGNFYYEYDDDYRCLSFGGGYGMSQANCLYAGVFAREWSQSEASSLIENPWQIFKPRSRVLYFPVSSGGFYEANLSLSALLAQDQSRSAIYDAGISLVTAAGAMGGTNANMNTALSLSISTAMAQSTANLFAESITLGSAIAVAPAATLTTEASALLSASIGAALARSVITDAATSLPASVTLAWGAETLGNNEVALSLSVQPGLSSSLTATLNTAITLGLQALMTPAGAAVYTQALALGATLGAAVNWDSSIEATLNLATALSLSDSVLRTTDASLPLGAIVSAVASSVASMTDTLALGLAAGQTITGGMDLDAAMTLSWSLSMGVDGATWEITTTMPNGRVVVIAATERLITITASDRTITMH